uniref:Myelin protein zero like 1 n=1 Tax=Taeniopygia guttata TaxID=59729 RepID=A0A674GKD0_TAEGU
MREPPSYLLPPRGSCAFAPQARPQWDRARGRRCSRDGVPRWSRSHGRGAAPQHSLGEEEGGILPGKNESSDARCHTKRSEERPVLVQVSAVEVNTPEEMFVENGTDAKLPCTFTSVEVISSAASVSWSFQPEGAATRISFFYYSNGKSYPGKDIPFKDRITWAGDLNKKDASITISNMQFRDNGTYICDVKNPPDIVVKPGEIRVRVVEKDLHAGFAIGGASGRESDSEWSPVIETLLTISKNAAGVLFTFLE